MNTIIKAPCDIHYDNEAFKIFLAGSIEMGVAEEWQSHLTRELERRFDHLVIFNPRRDNWDASLENTIKNPDFYQQVDWEFRHLEQADLILIYFSPETKSPISLLELGLFAATGKCVVCCPSSFWRAGNVEYICKKYTIPMIENYLDVAEVIKGKFFKMCKTVAL